MLLDPLIQRFLDDATSALEPLAAPGLSVAERAQLANSIAEKLHRHVAEPGPEVGAIRDHFVPVDGGEIRLRSYSPDGSVVAPVGSVVAPGRGVVAPGRGVVAPGGGVVAPGGDGPFPGYVVLHGGGWSQGSVEDWICDVQARERCAGSDSVVLVVDYRLAPEHPFPVPLEDCRAAWLWVVAHADELRIDRDRLSLGGVSAGGNLAAALCLLLRDRGEPLPVLQLLEVPVVDFDTEWESMIEFGPELGMDVDGFRAMVRTYVPDPADETNPYAAPLLAPELSGLPPAHIMTAEYDLLRDGAERYAARLAEAGVPVTLTRHAGQVHTSPVMTAVLEAARSWRAEVLDVLRSVAATEPQTTGMAQ